jgi:hypothetical protein
MTTQRTLSSTAAAAEPQRAAAAAADQAALLVAAAEAVHALRGSDVAMQLRVVALRMAGSAGEVVREPKGSHHTAGVGR